MNDSHPPKSGKMLKHGEGLGLSDQLDIEERATEVARIEGHRTVSKEDLREAALELDGGDVPPSVDQDDVGVSSLSRDPSEPASRPGRQIPNSEPEDEQSASERLVSEGVSEADHDQMLAARRRKREL